MKDADKLSDMVRIKEVEESIALATFSAAKKSLSESNEQLKLHNQEFEMISRTLVDRTPGSFAYEPLINSFALNTCLGLLKKIAHTKTTCETLRLETEIAEEKLGRAKCHVDALNKAYKTQRRSVLRQLRKRQDSDIQEALICKQ